MRIVDEERVYEEKYWFTLLHYKKTLFGVTSEIDDPKFFLSGTGKHNPKAELKATLANIFLAEDDNSICQFIARVTWLQERLQIDTSLLPFSACAEYDKQIKQFFPKSVVVIFPAAFMNNPASMFGHTLLNLKEEPDADLLSQSVNYSAQTTERFGPLFALKGIFGFYKGYFEILPYFARIQLYNDINQRDLWEYELNLTPPEIQRIMMHLWELRKIYSDYFFFDENCAYNLLYLLEIARPTLTFTDKVHGYILPLDTIRLMNSVKLVSSVNYRPSKATKIKHISHLLPEHLKDLSLKIARSQFDLDSIPSLELPGLQLIHVLDLATECLQNIYFKNEITQKIYRRQLLNILKIRSQVNAPKDFEYDIPWPQKPETSHKTTRIGIGLEIEDGEVFEIIRFRPANHDLLDPDQAIPNEAMVEFLESSIRIDVNEGKIDLDELDLINIFAISPRNSFYKPISWKLEIGISRELFKDKNKHHLLRVNAGRGLAWNFLSNGTFYGLSELAAFTGKELDPDYAIGLGATMGYLHRITPNWKSNISFRGANFLLGDKHSMIDINVGQRFALTENHSIRLSFSREKSFSTYLSTTNIGYHLFF